MEDDQRRVLITRMLEAKSLKEVEAADKNAERWMATHPQDLQVIAARERLDKTGAKLREPKRGVKRAGWVAFAVTFAAFTLLIGTYTDRWGVAVLSALLLGEIATYSVWFVGGRVEDD